MGKKKKVKWFSRIQGMTSKHLRFPFLKENHKKNITSHSRAGIPGDIGTTKTLYCCFSLIIHTSVRGQHLKVFAQCSGSPFAVSFLCQSAAFLS